MPMKCCATSVTSDATDDGAVIPDRGKGSKDRRIPIESALVAVLEHYLDSPDHAIPRHGQAALPRQGLAAWPAAAPLLWGPMVTASHAARCSTGCCGRFVAPALLRTSSTAFSMKQLTLNSYSPRESPLYAPGNLL
jgi:hypothetical protein